MWNAPLKDEAMLEELTESVKETNALVEPESQADPKFQTSLAYTRITALMPNAGLCRPRPGPVVANGSPSPGATDFAARYRERMAITRSMNV
jgi:hypothetical protein